MASRLFTKKHTLDSDEEDDKEVRVEEQEVEGSLVSFLISCLIQKLNYKLYRNFKRVFNIFDYHNNHVIAGEEEGGVDIEDGCKFTPFHMRDEMESGKFDKDGTYIPNKDKVMVIYNWLK